MLATPWVGARSKADALISPISPISRISLISLISLALFAGLPNAGVAHAQASNAAPPAEPGATAVEVPPASPVPAPSGALPVTGTGDGRAALPGLLRTRVAAERPRGFAVRALGAYGYTESVGPTAGSHHRAAMSLGLSGQPLRWLGIGLSLDGRYDVHPNDGAGHDAGFVTSSMLEVRATPSIGTGGLALGGALAAFGYGNTGHAVDFDALSFEGSALVTFSPNGSRWFVAGELGYRLDRSDAAAPAAAVVLRPGDRLALGLSSYDALLVRVGGGVRLGPLDLYGEFSLDALVGASAPSFAVSPMHVALGARHRIGETLHVELFADAGLSARPAIPTAGPYVRVEPRFAVGLAFAYRFGGSHASASTAEVDPDETVGRDPDETPDPRDTTTTTTTPEGPRGRTLEGRLLDAGGAPLVDAHVVVTVGEARLETFSDAQGHFVITGIPDGEALLAVDAVSHAPLAESLGRGALVLPDGVLRLELASAHGVLRGLVRGFDGEALAATITVMPGRHQAASDATGEFELTIAPGRYSVRVEARDYATQTREVTLIDGGVTILNVELRRDR